MLKLKNYNFRSAYSQDESSETKHFLKYETPQKQTNPAQYSVCSVNTHILLSRGIVCFLLYGTASQVSPFYTKKGVNTLEDFSHSYSKYILLRGTPLRCVTNNKLHLGTIIHSYFVSKSPHTIMPVPPILMAPRVPSSPTLISCSLWKK